MGDWIKVLASHCAVDFLTHLIVYQFLFHSPWQINFVATEIAVVSSENTVP